MSRNGEDDEDLYEMVLGEHLNVKEKKEVKKTEKVEKSAPDYAELFRKLLIGSRAQIAQLKADNEKLKTNLQNAINSGGVVVCPNCTHHFNDRLCLLKPRSMRKMRARNCVELEFANEDDLEAWLHLNQLETNHDGLPTIFKVPKEPKNEKTSLKDVGSLLPQLDAFRIPKRRAEDVRVSEDVKRQKSEQRKDVKVLEDVKKQKIEKVENVKKEPSKLSLKDRITMPSEDVRKRKTEDVDSEDVERKKKRTQIVWEEPVPPTSISSSSKFTFKITERSKKEQPAASEPVKVTESKPKFKFVPTSMKNKQDPRTVQSTSSGVTSSTSKGSEDVVEKAATSSSSSASSSEATLLKKPISIPIPKIPNNRNVENVKIQKTSSNSKVFHQKPEDVKKRPSSKFANDRNSDDVTKKKALNSNSEGFIQKTRDKISEDVTKKNSKPEDVRKKSSLKSEGVNTQNPRKLATTSNSEVVIQKLEDVKKRSSLKSTPNFRDSEDVPPKTTSTTSEASVQKSEDVTSLQKTSPTSDGPFKKRISKQSRQSTEEKKEVTSSAPDVLGKILKSTSSGILNRCTFPTSSRENSEAMTNKKTPMPPAPEVTPSWNLLKVKKSPEVLEHIQKNAARRLKEGRRQFDEMIVVNEKKPQKELSLESLGVSREGLEILKRQLNASKSKDDAPAPNDPNLPASVHGAPEQCAPAPKSQQRCAPCVPNAQNAPAPCAPTPKAQGRYAPSAPAPKAHKQCAPNAPNLPASVHRAPEQCVPAPRARERCAPALHAPVPCAPAPNAPTPCAPNAPRTPVSRAPALYAPTPSAPAHSDQALHVPAPTTRCAPAPSPHSARAPCASNVPSAPVQNVPTPCAPALSAPEDDDDVLKEFFPTLSNPPKRFALLERQNSEFSNCSETASVFADGEELELLNLMRVESVVPPDGDVGLEDVEAAEDVDDAEEDVNDDKEDVNDDEEDSDEDKDNDDDFCLEDVEIDDDRRESESSTSGSDGWDLEHVEEPVRSESNVLEMKNDFRLSDDENAISPVTSTPKRRFLEEDVHIGEDDDFTMRMRDDSFQDELDWNYGLEDDDDVPFDGEEEEKEEGEITEENRHVANSEEQKTSRRETIALLKRRN